MFLQFKNKLKKQSKFLSKKSKLLKYYKKKSNFLKLQKYKKLRFYRNKILYLKYYYKIYFIITKNNFLIFCYDFKNNFIFWQTLKQIGFKKKQKKSPFVIAIFFELLQYNLINKKVLFLFLNIFGKNKFLKWYIKQLYYNYIGQYVQIIRKLKKSFNGCRLRQKRRL
jgi:ribosomal protein S11